MLSAERSIIDLRSTQGCLTLWRSAGTGEGWLHRWHRAGDSETVRGFDQAFICGCRATNLSRQHAFKLGATALQQNSALVYAFHRWTCVHSGTSGCWNSEVHKVAAKAYALGSLSPKSVRRNSVTSCQTCRQDSLAFHLAGRCYKAYAEQKCVQVCS